MSNLWDFLMISGGLFSLVLVVNILLARNKTQIDWILASIFFCHASIVINKGLACSGLVVVLPWTMHLDLFTFYLIGPVLYLYLRLFADRSFRLRWYHLLHLFPAVVIFLLYIPFLTLPVSEKLVLFPYYKLAPFPLRYIYAATYLVPSFLVFIYVGLGLKNLPRLSTLKTFMEQPVHKLIFILAAETTVFSAMMILAYFHWSWNMYRIIMNGLNQIVLCYFFVNQHFPTLYTHLKEEVRQYQDYLHLKGLDIENLKIHLERLLELDEIYLEPELSLSDMSGRLGLSPHQLSEFLNRVNGESFKSLINRYRLNKVQDLFLKYPDRTILDLAFDAGFRSKSSFNTLFSKSLGVTPSEYRRNLKS